MTQETIQATIARELDVRSEQVARTIELLDNENTIPFIARYRKEVTGMLDEEQIRSIQERLAYLRSLEKRKESVLKGIADQGKLTPELEKAIQAATVLQQVEDLYLPYKPKRRTRATMARELGLERLARMILEQKVTSGSVQDYARQFVSEGVPTAEDALCGARDIVAETIAEDAAIRQHIRKHTFIQGVISCAKAQKNADVEGKYRMYHEYSEQVSKIPPHRWLAIRRGESEKALKVQLAVHEEELILIIEKRTITNPRSIFADQARQSVRDSYKRLIAPAVERDLVRDLSDKADEHAIGVFATNLRALLLQPPLRGMRVMGIDPGYRTGCKVALVDQTGKFIAGTTIYPHEPQKQWDDAQRTLSALVQRFEIDVIAVGNGTASRETEQLAADVVAQISHGQNAGKTAYVMVSEAGASVYSASPLAREELPDMDVSMRGAVSIARRLQDPLSELVKIEPKAIGVGLYQHDVDQKRLSETLDAVVESAVNLVGVDVNTASTALLQYVAGINKRVAASMVAYRDEHGAFDTRQAVTQVKGLGEKAFEQCAGFLRIPGGHNPLDNTAIHPESYPVVKHLFEMIGVHGKEPDLPERLKTFLARQPTKELANLLGVGVPTLTDIIENLERPGRDPRDELPKPILRSDVLKIKDLKEGMILQGTVRNVVDFGAFVDIGVKQDGLVHVSQMGDRYVRNPHAVVSVGDVVKVRVISVDLERGRIGLSMKSLVAGD